ncbi:hypothetical protein ACSBQT_10825 [Brevibacterium sp. H602]|uniref:hypothetical protein n=1 Tax=Brevibacterium sp. H602 TaxID=3444316 RepID=UPI003EBDCACC
MKVAILDSEGRLMLFRNPERITETWWDGKCSIEAKMKADNSGIVFESFKSASAKLLTEYFEVGEAPGRTITESRITEAFGPEYMAWARMCLSRIGITVVPDPEPTPRQRLEALIFDKWGDRDDAQNITDAIVAEFDVSVKAPGGDES